jgi:hypothetical protein
MWHGLMSDVTTVSRDVSEACRLRQGDKQVYMSLPRPGVSIPFPFQVRAPRPSVRPIRPFWCHLHTTLTFYAICMSHVDRLLTSGGKGTLEVPASVSQSVSQSKPLSKCHHAAGQCIDQNAKNNRYIRRDAVDGNEKRAHAPAARVYSNSPPQTHPALMMMRPRALRRRRFLPISLRVSPKSAH